MKKKRYSHLFFRILLAVCIPLVGLLIAFNIFLFNLVEESSSHFHMLEARSLLLNLKTKYKPALDNANINQEQSYLKKQLEAIREDLGISKIFLVNPATRSLIIETNGETKKTQTNRKVLPKHLSENVNKALEDRRKGKPYTFVVMKDHLYGYIPIWYKETRQVLMLVTQNSTVGIDDVLEKNKAAMQISSALVLLMALLIVIYLTFIIVKPLQAINQACQKILGGDLGMQVKVKTGDEIEALADIFNRMSQGLLSMQSFAANANPLTKLPGNQVIKAEMMYRIKTKKAFVFFHADIDHFKAYNDAYGLEQGDLVLKDSANIMKKILTNYSRDENFLGHQGGDDYCLILSPAKSREIAELICKEFDGLLSKYYKKEDLERGYFETADTRELSMSQEAPVKKFPLMSISLAGLAVGSNFVGTYDDILSKATAVKKKAKKVPYSYYVIEDLKNNTISDLNSNNKAMRDAS